MSQKQQTVFMFGFASTDAIVANLNKMLHLVNCSDWKEMYEVDGVEFAKIR